MLAITALLGYEYKYRVVSSYFEIKIDARYINHEHYRYSPVLFNDQLYFPSDYKKNDYDYSKDIGMLEKFMKANLTMLF